ncbi:DUF6888 family protein [Nostoc sp. DedSLP03]
MNVMFQPIHIVRLDERSLNIFILARKNNSCNSKTIRL